MSNQPTSRPEPEALHRSMMQASLQVAALDRRVEEERRRDGLGPLLQPWLETAAALRSGEQGARLRAAEDERERARERYARLRDDYLRAVRARPPGGPSAAFAPAVVTLPQLLAPRGLLRASSPRLDAVIERDRHLRVGVAQRFEKTLGSLATAGHRTLTDPRAGELRGHLARMDGILARLQGKRTAAELSAGAREVGGLLAQMGDVAAAKASAAALEPFRALLEERRAALARLAGEAEKAAGARALHQRGALPQPSAIALGEHQLQTLRRLHPGIETLLRDSSATQLAAELQPHAQASLGGVLGAPGLHGLSGVRQPTGAGHLGAFPAGGLSALGEHGAIGRALRAQPAKQPPAGVRELHELIGTLKTAPRGSPLHQIALHAEDRRRQAAARAKARLHGHGSTPAAARAFGDAFHAHGRADFAAHVAPGGALYHLLQGAQRSHGLPVPHLASHFLQSRGAHPLLGTVRLFDQLRAEGYRPHFGLFGRLTQAASDAFHKATTAVAHTADDVARTTGGLARTAGGAVGRGISDLGHKALDSGQRIGATVRGAAGTVGRAAGAGKSFVSRQLQQATQFAKHEVSNLAQAAHRAYSKTTRTVRDVVHGGVDRVTQLATAVTQRAGEAGYRAARFGERALHTGLDALHRTGIAGGIGKGVRFGVSMLKGAAKYSPVGLAVQGFRKAGGLQGIWEKTKHTAGAAWQGVQKAYHATAGFLQSPAGQLLVTGLSLAATFVPGGVVVKSIVGGAIGAIQAISEGRDWKHVLLAAGTGALAGALPFLKLGPLATMGIGALTGAASALASGSSLKGALKAAAGGALDSFDPGALKALGRLKGLKSAQKILQGKQLSKVERLALEASHLKGPLGGLEKLMAKRAMRRAASGLEKAFSNGVRGGILVSGKAARAQGHLDKALAMGDRLEGGLSVIHQLAPQVAGVVGDNALGHLIAKAGDYAGAGDDRLKRALEMGHGASDRLQRYHGYLDKGLGYAGVKDPQKAYGRRTAREAAREGKRDGIEAVARDKLARHRLRHPELHQALRAPRHVQLEEHRRSPRRHEPRGALEKALARGKKLKRQGLEVAQGVHDGLEKVHGTVAKGLEYAGHFEGGLERAAALARQGAGVLGEDSELGAYLAHVADRADKAHGYLEQGIAFARDYDERVGKVEGGLTRIPGVRAEGARKRRKRIDDAPKQEHLQHGTHAEHAAPPGESDEERSRRGGGKPAHEPARAPATAGARKPAEHGLAKLVTLRKKAMRMGRKVDRKLGTLEGKLRGGIAAGDKVEHGLEQVSRIAGTLGDLFGDDSPIGHFADQVHESADKGHDKLHGALDAAARGKKGLHQGRELLEEALHLGAHRYVEKHHGEHVRRAHPDAPHREHLHGPATGGPDGADVHGAAPRSDAHAAVEEAALAVGHFGGAVGSAVKAVRSLLERGRAADAAERVRSLEELSAHAAALVKGAVRAGSADPVLSAKAADLQEHLAEIRAHFRRFVSGLSGLESKDAADRARGGERPGRPRQRPGGRRAQGDLVDEVLRGIDDGRVFADRGAHRGERPAYEQQEVDSAAIDTWIGSGEGVKLFSEVFGAFLPAEDAGRRGGRHHRRGGRGSRGEHEKPGREQPGREPRPGKGGFFARVFQRMEDFAEGVAHVAHSGAGLLGKAMHYAETGMHGLNVVEHAAGRVHGLADRAEGFLLRMHLGSAAGFAHQVGSAAGWIDERAKAAHGGLQTADEVLGEGKHDLEKVESLGHNAARVAHKAGKGRFGEVLHLFRAASDGDGTDGKLRPEQVRLGSVLDEPRRLDALTQARMEQFLGGDFAGVRVHVGPGAAQITSRYAAEAVTVKDHIFFAPGKFSPGSAEGQKLLAHELTHVLQKGRKNLDVRTAETEALHAEHGYGTAPRMETLNLSRPAPDFRLPDGEGAPGSDGIHTAKRTRSRAQDAAGKDEMPDGEEFLEKVSGRVYELLLDELEQSFESR